MAGWHWRGLKSLVHDGTDVVVELVREGHESTARNILRATDLRPETRDRARRLNALRRAGTFGILGAIRIINRGVEVLTDAGLDLASVDNRAAHDATRALPLRSDITKQAEWVGDGALGLLNGAVGDFLSHRNNPLGLPMLLRSRERYLFVGSQSLAEALPNASPRIAVFVHGLATTEWSWCLGAEAHYGDPAVNFGSLLERDQGYTALYVRYNTGCDIEDNARDLSHLLQTLIDTYPIEIEDLTLIGHSMGGLVTRHACHLAETQGMSWSEDVKRVFYLGSPHHGAALAKLGHSTARLLGAIDLPATRILSRILEGRSAGIKDLSQGVLSSQWGDTIPLAHANHHFIAATVTREADHLVAHLIGDLLVRVPSASGPTHREEHFDIEVSHHGGMMHFHLQNHPAVYERILAACA